MSIVPIEYSSISSSSNTLFCNDVDTFLDNTIINVSTIVINNGCVNIYFPVVYFNGLIYINSNSNTNVNLYLPILDTTYKYDTPIILESNKYRYVQYLFNKLPLLISVSTPNPPNVLPVNPSVQFYFFTMSQGGVLDPPGIAYADVSTNPLVDHTQRITFNSPIIMEPAPNATHKYVFYSANVHTLSSGQSPDYVFIPSIGIDLTASNGSLKLTVQRLVRNNISATSTSTSNSVSTSVSNNLTTITDRIETTTTTDTTTSTNTVINSEPLKTISGLDISQYTDEVILYEIFPISIFIAIAPI